jgi:hypothetical protein
MDKFEWNVNYDLLDRLLQIKENQNKPIKRGFKNWLRYIYNYKQEIK